MNIQNNVLKNPKNRIFQDPALATYRPGDYISLTPDPGKCENFGFFNTFCSKMKLLYLFRL